MTLSIHCFRRGGAEQQWNHEIAPMLDATLRKTKPSLSRHRFGAVFHISPFSFISSCIMFVCCPCSPCVRCNFQNLSQFINSCYSKFPSRQGISEEFHKKMDFSGFCDWAHNASYFLLLFPISSLSSYFQSYFHRNNNLTTYCNSFRC